MICFPEIGRAHYSARTVEVLMVEGIVSLNPDFHFLCLFPPEGDVFKQGEVRTPIPRHREKVPSRIPKGACSILGERCRVKILRNPFSLAPA